MDFKNAELNKNWPVGNGRYFIFGIRYWTSNPSKGLPDANDRVDMSFWDSSKGKPDGKGGYGMPFDFGLYNDDNGLLWHANHNEIFDPKKPMKIYQSSNDVFNKEYPDSFNRTVYVVSYSPYDENVRVSAPNK